MSVIATILAWCVIGFILYDVLFVERKEQLVFFKNDNFKYFSDFTTTQIIAARDAVQDMVRENQDIQKIADTLQFSTDEVKWLINQSS